MRLRKLHMQLASDVRAVPRCPEGRDMRGARDVRTLRLGSGTSGTPRRRDRTSQRPLPIRPTAHLYRGPANCRARSCGARLAQAVACFSAI